MGEPLPALFAISYRYIPELRYEVEGWEQRALLAGVGLALAYAVFRLRKPGTPAPSWSIAAVRLVLGGIASAGLWVMVDVVRGEDFLRQVWTELPKCYDGVIRAAVLVTTGWAGWAVAVCEGVRRFTRTWRDEP